MAVMLVFYQYQAPKAPVYNEVPAPPGNGVLGSGTSTDPYDVLVAYTDAGYSPAEVTIQKGQRVRFVNRSTEPTWPASAIHPTHSLYPGKEAPDCLGSAFDACRGLVQGEFWAFTFNHAGEWRYHDHLYASKTGVIIVTP